MNGCDECKHNDSCDCIPYGCECFDFHYKEHDKQVRADAIKECKYNVELFKEIFLEELERQAVNREEIFMYRDICSMAWNKYLEQIKEQK